MCIIRDLGTYVPQKIAEYRYRYNVGKVRFFNPVDETPRNSKANFNKDVQVGIRISLSYAEPKI